MYLVSARMEIVFTIQALPDTGVGYRDLMIPSTWLRSVPKDALMSCDHLLMRLVSELELALAAVDEARMIERTGPRRSQS